MITGEKMAFFENSTRYEFHISRKSRAKYKIDESLYSIMGNLLISDFRKARYLSQQINQTRIKEGRTGDLVTAGQINALGLLHEILHFLIRYYEEKENPGAITRALDHLNSKLTPEKVDSTLLSFIQKFPPIGVYKGEISAEEFLKGASGIKSNREILLEEIFLLNIENINPATSSLEELYSDKELAAASDYSRIVEESEHFFKNEKPLGSENLPLFDFLKRPIVNSPYSLTGQLDYIKVNWHFYIFELFNTRLLSGSDLIEEDARIFYKPGGFDKPTPPVPVYEFDENYFDLLRKKLAAGEHLSGDEARFYYSEYEKFTHDTDWMPKVVMIAKNIYVWLHQLSEKYGRELTRLDQVPDEELDILASWNFTALWLIGIWERSSASRKIKQIMGNPEAASSAYSLFDYVIAGELGGEDSFQNLKHRAGLRGIRIASDMVPNHTGIYSKWIVEKPDYFMQVPYTPYPSYSFNGPNLSDDPRVEVRIEDKYYDHTDAAVIFQRRDSHTGDIKYIYHGNDGTHMPWNDTAQLNLLNPELKESLIQTIMHVARKTPIIRFDAAMTLAKKHYQRLWFPQPGTGGAIPSRSDFSMTREEFDRALPEEFWREVVDRINKEMPETLLLAEAFWLMEGYFVRTLGMHRVYNSAFMHMMMKEENEKYRLLIKNTLEFNAEILKRYVNFMSNPDEETAINQFGKGDKYFGVAIMMITLPGLPMFAHGQVDGFSEKYGMEYKKAYYNEYPDGHLIQRHRDEIFPLLRKRYLFSQVNNFEFYDFITNSGETNENVFAFSNCAGDEKALVVYNNSYFETKGTVNFSFSRPFSGAGYRNTTLAAALNLKDDYRIYYKVYEHKSRLQYLFSAKDLFESGMYIPLWGYEYRVYLGFEEIHDLQGDYEKLYRYLEGRGVFSIDDMLRELTLAPFHYALADLLGEENYKQFEKFIDGSSEEIPDDFNNKIAAGISELSTRGGLQFDTAAVHSKIKKDLHKVRERLKESKKEKGQVKKAKGAVNVDQNNLLTNNGKALLVLLPRIFFFRILNEDSSGNNNGYKLFRDLLLDRVIFNSLNMFVNPDEAGTDVHLIKILSSEKSVQLLEMFASSSARSLKSLKLLVSSMFVDAEIRSFLHFNEFENIKYFSKEKFYHLLEWFYTINIIFNVTGTEGQKKLSGVIKKLKADADSAGYKVDALTDKYEKKELKRNVKKKQTNSGGKKR